MAALSMVLWSSSAGAVNSIIVDATRVDDFLNPLSAFAIFFDIDIPDVAGVTGVTVTPGGGGALALSDEGGRVWEAEIFFADFASMKVALNGVWIVDIAGASPSSSTFSINAGPLVDGDFFPTATGIFPANGATGVPANVVISWNDPTGAATADLLFVSVVGSTDVEQSDNSLFGALLLTDTSWAPPVNLDGGFNELDVEYLDFDSAGLVTSLTVNSGAITWGDSPLSPVGYPSTTPLLILGSDTIVGFDVAVVANNSIVIGASRLDDFLFPLEAFFFFIDVEIPDVVGVTGVTVTPGGGAALVLDNEGADTWESEIGFADLASMKAALNGVWTVDIAGASPSSSTFSINSSPLVDGDFFPTATGLFPVNGATGVPANVVISWNDPTGAATADALFVDVFGPTGGQEDNSFLGSLLITDTTWTPPVDLEEGFNELDVEYLNVDQAGLVSLMSVDSGVITWGDSPFAPVGYPPATPLLVIGSETIVGFDVAAACPADLNGDNVVNAADLATLLAQWGAPGSAEVNAADLANLLASWGPCV